MKTRLLTNAALLIAGLTVAWLMWPGAKPMPETSFNLVDGRTLHSKDLSGKSLLINFWSISCEVCLRDIPTLTRLQQSLEDRGLLVIAVAAAHDPPPAVIAAVEKLNPGYAVALDVRGEVSAAFGGIDATPTTFLIAPDGNIRYSAQGPLDETRIRATILTFQG